MFCPKCGKQLDDNAKFCGGCGAPLQKVPEQNPTTSPNDLASDVQPAEPAKTVQASQPVQPAESVQTAQSNPIAGVSAALSNIKMPKINKKMIIIITAAVAVIIGAIVGLSIYNRPEAQMNRAIDAGSIKQANSIYRANLIGKGLSEKTVAKLRQYADGVLKDYEDGKKTLDEALSAINLLSDFAERNDGFKEYFNVVKDKIYSASSYRSAIDEANAYFANADYLAALNSYKRALELRSDSKDASDGVAKATEAYKKSVLENVDKAIADKKYSDAESYLENALYKLPDDADLKAKLDGLDDAKIQNIVDEAYAAADSQNWDSAVEMLEKAQNDYDSNEKINKAYTDIKDKMPITLKNITTISSDDIKVFKEVIKDRYDNIYDGAVRYNGHYDEAYGLYNLDGKYTTFTAKAFASTSTGNDVRMSISIYLDEELVYFKDEISNETAPLDISLNATGKKTMKIVVKDTSNVWQTAELYFGNSSFVKAGALPAATTPAATTPAE